MRAALILSAFFATFAAPAFAAPQTAFGLPMGAPLSSLKLGQCREGGCELLSVPKPHEQLTRYSVVATEAAGLCKVTGARPIGASGIDGALREIKAQLTELYKEPIHLTGLAEPTWAEAWLWVTPDGQGFALTRITDGKGGSAAMLEISFSNAKACEPPPKPNPFR